MGRGTGRVGHRGRHEVQPGGRCVHAWLQLIGGGAGLGGGACSGAPLGSGRGCSAVSRRMQTHLLEPGLAKELYVRPDDGAAHGAAHHRHLGQVQLQGVRQQGGVSGEGVGVGREAGERSAQRSRPLWRRVPKAPAAAIPLLHGPRRRRAQGLNGRRGGHSKTTGAPHLLQQLLQVSRQAGHVVALQCGGRSFGGVSEGPMAT